MPHHPHHPASRGAPLARQRSYAAARTALIGYGVAAFSYLFSRSVPTDTIPVFGGIPAWGLVLGGVGMQVLLIAIRALLRRRMSDQTSLAQGELVLELLGDGMTVLLFALGTFGAILQTAGSF